MTTPAVPEFLRKMNLNYGARAGNVFLLHGNVHDIFPAADGTWISLTGFLVDECDAPDRIFIHLDLSGGFTVLSTTKNIPGNTTKEPFQTVRDIFAPVYATFDELHQQSIVSSFAGLVLAKEITDRLYKQHTSDQQIMFIITDVATLAPNQSDQALSENDRRIIQMLQKWLTSRELVESRHAVIMTSEGVEAVNQKLRSLPHVTLIKLPRPDRFMREEFLVHHAQEMPHGVVPPNTHEATEATAGLTLQDIARVLRTTEFRARKESGDASLVTLDTIKERAREVLEQSLGGFIEFLDCQYGFEKIVGQKKLSERLGRLAAVFRAGRIQAIPNGILISGPNGGGKSFIMKAFAKETGWHVLRLKNLRSMWYGETERIWEMIEDVIEAIGRVIIMVDEGDTELGGRGREVHEVDKRLFGKILRMMEDKKNQGRVSWIIVTARPDKLEPDIKRSGRAGRHYPVFAPETDAERKEFVKQILLARFPVEASPADTIRILEQTRHFYPADFDLLCEELEEAMANTQEKFTIETLFSEIQAFHPANPVLQRKLQITVALLEATDERVIPDSYLDRFRNKEELLREIVALKRLTGELY